MGEISMAEKTWHPNFIKYISDIANHPIKRLVTDV